MARIQNKGLNDYIKAIQRVKKGSDVIIRKGIDDGDYVHAKIGWDGYGRTKTKKYPEGVPNQLIVRSINSGSSFRKKNPFVNRAVTKNKKTAVKAMADTIENEIKKEMK